MYPVSQAYLQAIQSTRRTKAVKVHVDAAYDSFDLTDADVQQATLKHTRACIGGDTLAPGAVVIADLEISLINTDGRFDDTQFNGGVMTVQDGTELADGSTEWVPLGVFNIDDVSRPTTVVTLSAADNLLLFDQPFSDVPITFPATNLQILQAMCAHCGVPLKTASFLNSDYSVASAPDGSMSCRDVLSDICEMAAGFARCDRTGELEIVQLKGAGYVQEAAIDGGTFAYTDGDSVDGGDFSHWNNRSRDGGMFSAASPVVSLDPSNRYNFSIDDSPVTITGVELDAEDQTYLVGSNYYAVHISDNKLIQGDPTAVLNAIFDALYDFTYLPFTSDWQGNPALDPGDLIEQTDRKGNAYRTIVTNSTYVYRGRCTLQAKGASQLSQPYQSTMTKKVSQLIRSIHQKQVQLDSLNQAIVQATSMLCGIWGGHVVNGDTLDEQYHGNIFIADNADITQAVKVWRWNLGGFGYSENGADGPYAAAITADGSIVANIIHGAMIIAGTITADQLASSAVTTDKLAANAVTADKIAAHTITGDQINADTVAANKLTSPDSTVYGTVGTLAELDYGLKLSDSAHPSAPDIFEISANYNQDSINLWDLIGNVAFLQYVAGTGGGTNLFFTTPRGNSSSIWLSNDEAMLTWDPFNYQDPSGYVYCNSSGVHCSNGWSGTLPVYGSNNQTVYTIHVQDGIITGYS